MHDVFRPARAIRQIKLRMRRHVSRQNSMQGGDLILRHRSLRPYDHFDRGKGDARRSSRSPVAQKPLGSKPNENEITPFI